MRTAHELVDWQGYMTHAEVNLLQNIASELPADAVVVKIGAGAGTDTIAILETTQDLVIFSVDILAGESPEYTNEHLRLEESGYDKTGCVIRIWGDSKIVGKRWPMQIDWLHIDGCHSYECISGDIDAWCRHVRNAGLISFHDYGSDFWPNVKSEVDKSMDGYVVVGKVDTLIVFRKAYNDTSKLA